MKFLQKHKNKISALCIVAVLLSCFMGFSVSSSADEFIDYTLSDPQLSFARPSPFWTSYYFDLSDGVYSFNHQFSDLIDTELYFAFLRIFYGSLSYEVPSVDGKAVSLMVNLSLSVDSFEYLQLALDNDPENLYTHAIFNGARFDVRFSDGTNYTYPVSSYMVFDSDSGQYIDPQSNDFWLSHVNSPFELDIYASINLNSYIGKTISSIAFYFPNGFGTPLIYYNNSDTGDFLRISDVETTIRFGYLPTVDIIGNGFTSVNDRLDSVNSKLDSISSSMNTIDQDINRVNQTVSDLRDDLMQGDPDVESSNSDLQDKVTDAKDEIGVIDSEINSVVSDILDRYPDAENPFNTPDVPIISDIWASEFIEELWGFFKAQSIFFTFIHTGLLFCLVSFILRR